MPEFAFRLNEQDVTVDADAKTSTLEVLREQLGVLTCKAGCSPQGLCGCCTALVDGKPRLTCTLPVKSLVGKSVTTLDGVPEADKAVLAESFVECGATQCGYCTPGITLSAWALLSGNPAPQREEITRALNQHLCRCTGYTAIYKAIDRAAAKLRGEDVGAPTRPRPEGVEVVLGDRPYVDDLEREGLLYGGVVFAPVARGTVTALDVEPAKALPGVRAALVLRGVGEAVRGPGDVVAAVVAESLPALRAGLAAVVVAADAAEAAVEEVVEVGFATTDAGWELAAGDQVFEGRFEAAPTDPVYFEPEATLAVPVGGGLHVYSPAHDAAGEAAALSAALGTSVRVFLVPSGGSYGGKAQNPLGEVAGRLALATGAPVRVAVGLEVGMRLHPRRPGGVVDAKLVVGADGLMKHLHLRGRLDGGVAPQDAARIAEAAAWCVPYDVASLDVEVAVLRTGSAPAAPVRGAGATLVGFAVEQLVRAAAAARGEDGLAFRVRNTRGHTQALLAALEGAWAEAPEGRRGLAVVTQPGAGGARVVLTVTGADEVEVQCNVPELGQGRDEVLANVLARVTGLGAEVFTVAWADSAVVGAGAPASAPVDEAAAAAGRALRAAGGPLAGLVGRRFVGEGEAGEESLAAVLVTTGEQGEAVTVLAAVGYGEGQDPRLVANLAEGGGHMGLGVAVSEEVAHNAGLPDGRFRVLGVLKPKGCPRFEALPVGVGGRSRAVEEAVVAAVPAAVGVAVAEMEGAMRARLPMRDAAVAKALGVKPAK